MSLKVYYKGDQLINETDSCVKKLDTTGQYLEDDVIIDYSTKSPPEKLTKHLFIDYDGTPLYEYSLTEIKGLTQLPPAPQHEGLTFVAWNWTLENLKTEPNPIIVGANYATSDGHTRIYIDIPRAELCDISLQIVLKGTLGIDWGDGTAIDTKTANTADTVYHHIYNDIGKYCITFYLNDGGTIQGCYQSHRLLVDGTKAGDTTVISNDLTAYNQMIYKIESGLQNTGTYGWIASFIDSNVTKLPISNKAWFRGSNRQMYVSNIPLKALIVPLNGLGNDGTVEQVSLSNEIISLPHGLTALPNFYNCKKLKYLTIPSTVTSISGQCFGYCESLQSLILPSDVIINANATFQYCSSLKELDIPTGTTTLGLGMFQNCTALQTIFIPTTVTSISANAFFGCTSIKNINIPSNVTSIGNSAFNGCRNLKAMILPNNLTTLGNQVFTNCSSLIELIIPNSVTSIGTNLCANGVNSTSLIKIQLPNTITLIPDSTAQQCQQLQQCNIPSTVTSIGQNAFNGCYKLKEINLPENLTMIGVNAFYDCRTVLTIKIPNTVTSIGNQAFRQCYSMRYYDFTDWTNANIDACTFGTNIFQALTTNTEIRFKYKSVRDHAAQVSNLVSFASYMTYQEDDT